MAPTVRRLSFEEEHLFTCVSYFFRCIIDSSFICAEEAAVSHRDWARINPPPDAVCPTEKKRIFILFRVSAPDVMK